MKTSRMFAAAMAFAACACGAEEPLDCSRKYHQDGHEQTTAYVARELALDTRTQRRLAFFTQAPDDLAMQYSAPAVGVWGVVWIPYRQRIVDSLHSLHGGDHAAVQVRRQRLETMITKFDLRRSEDHWKVGFLIHALGDSYAHVHEEQPGRWRSYNAIWGHIFDNGESGSQPDVIAKHPRRYADYVDALCRSLSAANPGRCGPDFGQARACAVIQQHGPASVHAPGRIDAAAGEPTKAEVYQEIRFGEVDAFLQRVKRLLDAPGNPAIQASDL